MVRTWWHQVVRNLFLNANRSRRQRTERNRFTPSWKHKPCLERLEARDVPAFGGTTNFPAGINPFAVSVADLNGDGKADLVSANTNSNNVGVLLGNGDGSFQSQVAYPTGVQPFAVTVNDFNGDGKADLATANYGNNTLSVLLGNGDGTFQSQVAYPGGNLPGGIASGDLNGDGKIDLAIAVTGSSNIGVRLGNGDGTFQPIVTYPAGPNPRGIAIADFNGDGAPDIVTPNSGNGTASVMVGKGDGTFAAPVSYPTGTSPYAVAVSDLNGDGKLDFVIANTNSSNVSVLLGNGDGTFQPPVAYATSGAQPEGVAVGDFNFDGKLDIVTANVSGSVSEFLGNGDGTFQPSQSVAAGGILDGIALGDFDGNLSLDIAAANYGLNAVSVLLNQDFPPVPPVTGTPAKVTSITSTTSSGKYNAGDTIDVTVNFDQPVTLSSGTLNVNLNDGGTVTISPFSNSAHLTGTYTVAPGQNTPSLDTMSLTVVGGTLKDANGNTVTLAIPPGHSLASSGNFLIDTINPTVTISAPSAAATTTGPITYTISYGDTNFSTNTLTASDITLNKTGTANGVVMVSGGAGVFKTVTISNITGTGTLGISLAAGTATDTAGNLAPAAGPGATFSVTNASTPTTSFAVGGANGTVRLLTTAGDLLTSVTPIAGYTGLVSVALGDFNSDTVPDLMVASASPVGVAGLMVAQAGKVFVYDGASAAKGTLTLIHTFTPFANSSSSANAYTNGLNIAVGDVNGDGHADLVAGSRGGNGTTSGAIEIGRLVVIDGSKADGVNTVIGGMQTPFGAGYQKGVIVAAGDVDGLGGDEIAVTRGGPVNSPNPAVQAIKVKILQLKGTALTELPLNADGTTAFAPFAGLTGAASGINRDGRVAFVDSDGDGKDELVFSALDPLTNANNEQVRIGVYSISTTAQTGAATIKSTGSNAGTYLTGTAVKDHATTAIAATGAQQYIALLTESASSGVAYLAPLTGNVQAGGFSLNVVTGGITIDGI